MQQPTPARPEMSGALPDDNTVPRSARRYGDQQSIDHDLPEESNTKLNEQHRAPASRRRQSFFVVSDRRRDVRPDGDTAPPESINTRSATKTHTFEIGEGRKRRNKRQRESSLDALVQHTLSRHAVDVEETNIALPESRPVSSSSSHVELSEPTDQAKSSLDILLEKGALTTASGPLPSSVALPESRPQSSEEPRGSQQQAMAEEQKQLQLSLRPDEPPLPLYDYEQLIVQASEFLEHLRDGRIRKDSRHDLLNITFMDYPRIHESPTAVNRPDSQNEASLLRVLRDIPQDVKQRLIVVEDLSLKTINCLGRCFGVTPEFFEEHLINSGYMGLDYNDAPSHTWTTADMKKPYVSMRWHRPVFRLPVVPFSENDLKELLDPKISRLEYISDTSRHMTIYQTETNIFRSEWGLWTDPTITPRKKRVCGWEERASLWSQKLPDRDCQIVILLLDPMPTVGQGIERDVVAARRLSDSNSESSDENSDSARQQKRRLTDAEELDRLAEHMQKRELMPKPQVTWLQQVIKYVTGTKRFDNRSGSGLENEMNGKYEYFQAKKFESLRSLAIFEQTAHRAHVLVDYNDAFQDPRLMDTLRQQLSETRATTLDFWQRLTSTGAGADSISLHGIVKPLFQIVHRDTINLLKTLHNSLDGINLEILDDAKMEERLAMWRLLITRAQFELPELKRSATQFLSFLELVGASGVSMIPKHDTADSRYTEGASILNDFEDLCKKIDEMTGRLQTASSSLTSNMALLDSRRSIAEAQAVTKLTELAFFFIPLSFAATLFGMQIEQFENRAPLWIFVVIGLGFVAASYLVRLLIRSTWLRSLLHAYRASIKFYADSKRRPVQRGNIPASLFLSWTGYEVKSVVRLAFNKIRNLVLRTIPRILATFWRVMKFSVGVLLIICILGVTPIAVLWKQDTARGTKISLTIVILMCVFGILAGPYWRYSDPDSRAALPKFLKKLKRIQNRFAVLIGFLCAIAIAVVPLTIIWTRPISPGIRVAVTVVIILMIFTSIFSWALYKLASGRIRISHSAVDLNAAVEEKINPPSHFRVVGEEVFNSPSNSVPRSRMPVAPPIQQRSRRRGSSPFRFRSVIEEEIGPPSRFRAEVHEEINAPFNFRTAINRINLPFNFRTVVNNGNNSPVESSSSYFASSYFTSSYFSSNSPTSD